MKNKLKIMAVLAAVAVLSAFKPMATTYTFSSEDSKIVWLAKKVTGEHTGFVKLKKGSLVMDGEKITGGNFVTDMSSITCTDLENEKYNQKLVGHLKSEDFFHVDKFKEASLTITNAELKEGSMYEITGDMTIKGITNEISFPAKVDIDGKKVKATAKITIDRTKYEIKYGSGSFFDGLGDKMIYDDFELNIVLKGMK